METLFAKNYAYMYTVCMHISQNLNIYPQLESLPTPFLGAVCEKEQTRTYQLSIWNNFIFKDIISQLLEIKMLPSRHDDFL